jgi:hypothetical protein
LEGRFDGAAVGGFVGLLVGSTGHAPHEPPAVSTLWALSGSTHTVIAFSQSRTFPFSH